MINTAKWQSKSWSWEMEALKSFRLAPCRKTLISLSLWASFGKIWILIITNIALSVLQKSSRKSCLLSQVMLGIRIRGSCQRQSGVKETQRKRLFINRRNGDLSILRIFEPLTFISGNEKDDFSLLGYKILSTAEGDNFGCMIRYRTGTESSWKPTEGVICFVYCLFTYVMTSQFQKSQIQSHITH